MTVKTPAAAAARRARSAATPATAALHPQRSSRGDHDRPLAALGDRGGAARATRRGGRRPRPGDDPHAPPRLRLPAGKTFDAWEPDASSIPKPTQQALRTLEWIGRAEALCVCGPSGTGKSHLVEALGHLAIDHGKTVTWHTLESLATLLRRHRADDSVNKAIGRLIRADLIVIDDIGMLPVAPDAAEALFRIVDAAYERRSIALTSNIHPAGFDELMPKTLAAATVDRLLHHAHVLVTDGTESYRLTQATAGKGVMPLA